MLIWVYTKLFPALVVLSDGSKCFVLSDFPSALESASIAMTAYKVSSMLIIYQFVHLNGLKWPVYKYGPLSNIMSILL